MDIKRLLALLLVVGCVSAEYKRVCYYVSKSQYRSAPFQFLPEDIDPFLCTHIIYSFGQVVGLTIKPKDMNDESTIWKKGLFERTTALKKQNPDLKVLLAIGGWNHEPGPFTNAVKTDSHIDLFVKSSTKYLRDQGFDGLDLHWQYPANRGSPPEDKQRFTRLVQKLHDWFVEDARVSGKERLLLSAAVSPAKGTVDRAYEIVEIARSLDFINLLTYAFHGPWDSSTGHNSPLYARSDEWGSQRFNNQDWAAKYWIQGGTPREKLILGIATYGRTFKLTSKSNHGFHAPASGHGSIGKYTRNPGFLAYYEICSAGWTTVWSDEHQVPYAYSGDQWVGYDNRRSVEVKAKYIIDNGLGGAMFWALDLDDFKNKTCNEGLYPLISAVKKVFTTGSPAHAAASTKTVGSPLAPKVTSIDELRAQIESLQAKINRLQRKKSFLESKLSRLEVNEEIVRAKWEWETGRMEIKLITN